MLSLLIAGLLVAQQPAQGGSLRALVLTRAQQTHQLEAQGFHAHSFRTRREADWTVAEVVLPERDLPALRAALPGSPVHIVERSRPLRDILAEWRLANPGAPDPLYKTPAEIESALRDFETNHAGLAKRFDFQSRYGTPRTHDGQLIHLLRISDNAERDEDEPNIVVFTNNHSREINTPELSLYVANLLLTGYGADPELTRLVNENQIWIIPTMNPDGLETVWTTDNMWRKNRRDNGDGSYGVDLNRNYPYFWSRCGSSSRASSGTYHGPSAASEPETQAMIAFTAAEGIERLIDTHSFARDIRSPHNPLNRGNLPRMVTNFYDPLHAELASAMNYRVNNSCCCGTHMEWHHSTHGTLAFLVEMGTAFQPDYAETLSELERMWPGIRAFLTKPVPIRGHVRSMAGNVPLDAQITVDGQPFRDGQEIRAFGRHGRYSLWIAPGVYDVTFSAAGHDPVTLALRADAIGTLERDVVLQPTFAPVTLSSSGNATPGGVVDLNLRSPDEPGQTYFLPVSVSSWPPIQIGERTIPIAASFLLDLQLTAPSIFVDATGTLDSRGRATGQFVIPNDPQLVGGTFWFAGLTLDLNWPFAVRGISNAVRIDIR